MTYYEVYLRNDEGKRSSLINGIVSVDVTFRFNEPVKWKITGAGLEECPLNNGAEIAVFRNGAILFCGAVDEKLDSFDAMTHIYDWEISGYSDLRKLDRRLIYPDPSESAPDPDAAYTATGTLSTLLHDAIKANAGTDAISARQLAGLVISEQTPVGDSETIDSQLDRLLKFVQDKLEDTDIQIRETWDMAAGEWDIKIGSPKDVSSKVIFSVDNGTLSAWERTVTAPDANWLLVTGCKDEDDQTMSCIVFDAASIAEWGRIEAIVSRSDIKPNEDAGESWQSVADRLEAAAYEELEKASAQFGYKLTTTEIKRNVYPDDYDIGSVVTVRIGSDEFTASVEEIRITYEEGIETIVPSVGTMQRGELQSVFTELGTLKEQIKVLQKSA